MAEENKFPSEVIDLPSKGKVYSKDSPLSSGKIELKYMTAKEEDILTSQNLIKKGIVIQKVLDSLILTQGISSDDLILGDKNAVMVAARILAYGPEYTTEITNPNTGNSIQHIFDLTKCPYKEITGSVKGNDFEVTLPVSKIKIRFRLLTGKEESQIDSELKSLQKTGSLVSTELTTRLKYTIISVDGNEERPVVNNFVDNMLSKDSLFLRGEIAKISPDIELKQEIELEGDVVEVDIPLTMNFFWPNPAV